MSFKILLSRLLEDIPGALGAIIIDWEGEAVDQIASANEYDLKVLGAHNGIVLSLLREALSRTASGELEEIVIHTGSSKTLIAPLTEDYLLILQLGSKAITAQAAHKVRYCMAELRRELD